MKKGRFVCLIGIDGSDKTTIAKKISRDNPKMKYVQVLSVPSEGFG